MGSIPRIGLFHREECQDTLSRTIGCLVERSPSHVPKLRTVSPWSSARLDVSDLLEEPADVGGTRSRSAKDMAYSFRIPIP